MPHRFSLTVEPARFGLFLILFLTMANGFFNSLAYEFGAKEKNTRTFLFAPEDRHGDLVKVALLLPPFVEMDISRWDPLYQAQYTDKFYSRVDLTWEKPAAGKDSALVLPPVSLLIYLLLKLLILATSPSTVVLLYYVFALVALGLLCQMVLLDWRSRVFAWVVLGFSYPFLMILTRGNLAALLTGLLLCVFLYQVCLSKNFVVAAVCLGLACNFRPNAIALAPLLFCFGLRNFFYALGIVTLVGACSFFSAMYFDRILYPGWDLGAFQQGVANYYDHRILGTWVDNFNSSAYGAFKALYVMAARNDSAFLAATNQVFCGFFMLFTLGSWFLYFQKKLSRLEFSFLALVLYMLASSQFATYHLLPIAMFVLLYYRDNGKRSLAGTDYIIVATAVFIMVPKNYYFYRGVSMEVFLNPLVLITAIAAIFIMRLRQPSLAVPVSAERDGRG